MNTISNVSATAYTATATFELGARAEAHSSTLKNRNLQLAANFADSETAFEHYYKSGFL
jgi:hypothetical protein